MIKEFELERGEEVIRQTRKHWFLFLLELLPYAILGLLPFAIPKVLAVSPAANEWLSMASVPLIHILVGCWLLVVWTSAWGAFTRYFLNVWILTSQRIVDIKQAGFFRREVSSLFLNRVQDVTTEVEGILPSLLDIGNITVQSAGAVDEFHMLGIPEPEHMRDTILRYVSSEPLNDPSGV